MIGDLPAIDRAWPEGITEATRKATEWQQDAVLSNLRVVCQLFETEFRWQATFYSRNAQAFFSSDTREVVPASIAESDVPELDTSAAFHSHCCTMHSIVLVTATTSRSAQLPESTSASIRRRPGLVLHRRLRMSCCTTLQSSGWAKCGISSWMVAMARSIFTTSDRGDYRESLTEVESYVTNQHELDVAFECCRTVLRRQPSGLLTDIDGTISLIAPTPDAAICQ